MLCFTKYENLCLLIFKVKGEIVCTKQSETNQKQQFNIDKIVYKTDVGDVKFTISQFVAQTPFYDSFQYDSIYHLAWQMFHEKELITTENF